MKAKKDIILAGVNFQYRVRKLWWDGDGDTTNFYKNGKKVFNFPWNVEGISEGSILYKMLLTEAAKIK